VAGSGQFRVPGRTYGDAEYEQLLGLGSVWAAEESKIDWSEFDLVWNLGSVEEIRSEGRWPTVTQGNLMIIGFAPRWAWASASVSSTYEFTA
jgi:hypothetical protein